MLKTFRIPIVISAIPGPVLYLRPFNSICMYYVIHVCSVIMVKSHAVIEHQVDPFT